MSLRSLLFAALIAVFPVGLYADFTVASFNCGALSDHYDYIRAVCMQKLVQERHNAQPEVMAQYEKIQNTALKILFSNDPLERERAEQEWQTHNYSERFAVITAHPSDPGSLNKIWREKSEAIVTPYNERPIVIHDQEASEMLQNQVRDMVHDAYPPDAMLGVARQIMARRIFHHQLNYDIIALQEADYLDASVFPDDYAVRFANTKHSVNGVAWNKNKFEIAYAGNTVGRGFIVALRELESDHIILVASGHLSGCNPFHTVVNETTRKPDSLRGDRELSRIINTLEDCKADLKIIAMDSNVTATHPRLALLKEAGYTLDYNNYLDATCTSPWQILGTRIDWIAFKSANPAVQVHNIPVLGVGLNSPQTNVSDHKPIAARFSCPD